MKAIRVNQFGEPESMALEEIAEPEPEAGQVRLQIAAAGQIVLIP